MGDVLVAAMMARALRDISPVEQIEGGFRITTHCIYPSNGLVSVTVRGDENGIVASDDGEALGEALSAGIILSDPDKLLRGFVKQRGLILRSGVILTHTTPIEAAAVAVLHVANTAKETASWLYEHWRHQFALTGKEFDAAAR